MNHFDENDTKNTEKSKQLGFRKKIEMCRSMMILIIHHNLIMVSRLMKTTKINQK